MEIQFLGILKIAYVLPELRDVGRPLLTHCVSYLVFFQQKTKFAMQQPHLLPIPVNTIPVDALVT